MAFIEWEEVLLLPQSLPISIKGNALKYSCEIAVCPVSVFGSPQYRVVSEGIVHGEVGFYLRVLGGSLSLSGRIVVALRFSFICVLFHYMLVFVFKNEVIKRMGKFQVFGECLHNVALIGCEFSTDF